MRLVLVEPVVGEHAINTAVAEGRSPERPRWWWLLGVAGLHAALAASAVWHALFDASTWAGPTDYEVHAVRGVDLLFPSWWDPGMPHFLLHLVARCLAWLSATDDPRVGMLVAILATCGAFGAALAYLIRAAIGQRPGGGAIAIATSVAVAFGESAMVWAGWSYQMPPGFFLPLNMPHSPTAMASRLPSLLLFLAVWRFVQEPTARSARWLPILVTISMFAKPALGPPLAVATVAWLVLRSDRSDRAVAVRSFACAVLAPMIAILVIQYWLIQRLPPPYVQHLAISPFEEFRDMGAGNPLFWLVFLPPVYAFVAFGPAMRRGPAGLAAATTAVALVMAMLLTTPGGIQYSGEMFHFVQHGVLIWTIVSVVEATRMVSRDPRTWQLASVGLLLVALPGVLGGWNMWSCHGGGPCLVR